MMEVSGGLCGKKQPRPAKPVFAGRGSSSVALSTPEPLPSPSAPRVDSSRSSPRLSRACPVASMASSSATSAIFEPAASAPPPAPPRPLSLPAAPTPVPLLGLATLAPPLPKAPAVPLPPRPSSSSVEAVADPRPPKTPPTAPPVRTVEPLGQERGAIAKGLSKAAPPQGQDLTVIGVLGSIDHPAYAYFVWRQRMTIKTLCTHFWPSIQAGTDEAALGHWRLAMRVLSLDMDAMGDMCLLIAQGPSGRCEANEILWSLLTKHALVEPQRNLSHLTSTLVTRARHRIDRPPASHADSSRFSWKSALLPQGEARFHPNRVPQGRFEILTGPQGEPLAPPRCWRLLEPVSVASSSPMVAPLGQDPREGSQSHAPRFNPQLVEPEA